MEDIIEILIGISKNLIFALLVLLIGLKIIKIFAKRLIILINKGDMDDTLKPFISSILNVLSKIILAIIVISILGIDTSSFIAVLASAGFAIGLAFQGSLSNFAGGILLLTLKPFKIGDYIESEGHAGTVVAIKILYTQLNTIDNKVIFIPNGSLSNNNIMNYSANPTRRVDFKFSVSYNEKTEKVKKILEKIVKKHPLILKEPQHLIRMIEHSENAIIYTVRVWVETPNYFEVYFDIMEEVKNQFDKEKISIPYPQMDVHINNKK